MSKIQYRKRVPIVLQPILNRKEFRLIFNTQDEATALDTLIDNAIMIMKSNLPMSSKQDLVRNTMEDYVIHTYDTRFEISPTQAIALYLSWSKTNVTPAEFKTRSNFFTKLLPVLFRHLHIPMQNTSTITSKHLYALSQKISSLPNRVIYKYQSMDLNEFVKIKVPLQDQISIETANKLIKRIRSLANYGKSTGLFIMPNTIPTIKIDKHKSRSNVQREHLTHQEIELLFSVLPCNAKLLAMIVYYSGLRPSEISKCNISNVANIPCFDLRSPDTSLKTISSYRIVPMHSSLLPHLNAISNLSYANIRSTSRIVKRYIDQHLNSPSKKSLYSLRHSFITHLINANVSPEIVSELAGHTHNTMTMQRYFKGYDISTLKQVIDIL